MKVVMQRVTSASVRVEGNVVGQIGKGLLCFVGIGHDDTEDDAEWCCRRLLNARLWPDEAERAWRKSLKDNDYEVLLVSQFTLHGQFAGNKPDFHLSMAPKPAKEFYDAFCDRVRREYIADKVAEGEFGAYMEVSIVNDGPVTMQINSKDRKLAKK
ncbi:D-tyrosyl-tRNA(Tyr) deacylase [Phytophthora nicotianae CJ01A1]|uniref:D-aminoacyl-tRNA deacylase n=6 Tax=Phytophthora nicotianae TaxID=4792 RepID=W2RA74_PHYN3|nr:D-tyrosyl-tRNA(Tyr) deacylase [Phytophthora nicotianae INRA-310]ETI45169.1 D-tyrosyl-tRNA(Tyr) deacylase [Phytophthora nicotianae P1569]ETK85138.1 D-tyrosyl-tRNA(Tyr) deacylase [Phytophthora nicotianae]ETO73825.1 D-tyrosyl-tRNA(Tyr) deacylase [Phytophthora nicotianae P1976]ETP14978.1 D-tyrosyl-tRNA(Tyr) deacylase [Phytophthora nicotianae CJ01A1]ETP43063.1 D-tyrosyl-tRNA(Tyr) deacylase [Phytophthora nicotianae P10297]KUF83238.1 D-tyrosyl-tRNA(Tyr) deacylase [Phytophthora nicotianae]